MKKENYISQFMLERFFCEDVTLQEKLYIEKALKTYYELLNRYEEIKKSFNEISLCYPLEKLPKLNEFKDAVVPVYIFNAENKKITYQRKITGHGFLKKKPVIFGICAAAAFLCVFLFMIFIHRSDNFDNDNIITEEPSQEIVTEEVVLTETPPPSELVITPEQMRRLDPESGIHIASEPVEAIFDTGIRTRGLEQTEEPAPSEPVMDIPPNINIPAGMSFIFENMFANMDLTYVIIPHRIRSIARNAFYGNPLVSITIGADVFIEENAFPGNFLCVYIANNRAGKTYTRADAFSNEWRGE